MLRESANDLVPGVPIIDLTETFSDDFEARKRVADKVRLACKDTGFFYVRNHGVPQAAIDGALDVSKRFFAKTAEEKMPLQGEGGYGYDPPQVQVLDPSSPPDLKEGFMTGPPESELARSVKFPPDMPELQGTLKAYEAEVTKLGVRLMRSIALSLDLLEDYFEDGFDRPGCSVRLLHYSPRPTGAPQNQIGAGAHTDWGAITILYQDDVGGLEIMSAESTWVRAVPVPGTYVINLGDMIRRWTNDTYRSTLHRVVANTADAHRYSIATFFNPRDDYRVACVPTCLKEGDAPNYPPCTVGEHIRDMVRKTYEGQQ